MDWRQYGGPVYGFNGIADTDILVRLISDAVRHLGAQTAIWVHPECSFCCTSIRYRRLSKNLACHENAVATKKQGEQIIYSSLLL